MKRTLKILSLLLVVFIGLNIPGTHAQVANHVPEYYYANYQFADDWNSILEWFKKSRAKYSVGQEFKSAEFAKLLKYFNTTFPHLTTDYSSVYEKCTLLAGGLTREYSYIDMESLMGNSCYKSLMQAIENINTHYTVQIPSVVSNPASGMAPLTVTFDARSSVDPSSETLPTNNFYWYYRDEKGVDRPMGRGQTINYTFEEPGKFIVHLVVRSSNVDKGILDGEKDIAINVTPKAADIVVYANTRKMTTEWPLKIGITEGEKGVVFDGSLTVPRGGRKILSHKWTIENKSIAFSYSKSNDGSPSYINVPLKGNGEFKVTLTTYDNEKNEVSETYKLYMSDPVAIIRQSPIRGTTSTTFTFDGSASYSITNKLNTYYWEVFDENGGDEQGDSIKWGSDKKFSINFADLKKKPGNYLVRLTVTDVAGNKNVETKELFVESTPPTPQFVAIPTKIWEYPSEYTLDASNSIDIDVENKMDSLEYSRSFSTNNVDIVSTENNNEKIVVRFNSTGKHKVTLTATDEYGKSTSISKDLDIKSILRPEITAIPGAITWGKEMKFESSVNSDSIYDYSWDFGDGSTNSSQFITDAQHIYGKKGIFDVVLKVTDDEGKRNSVKERVFIGEKDTPIAAYKVKNNGYFISASETCRIETASGIEKVKAFPIDRYSKFTIDPSYSVNTKGNNNGLQYAFSKQSIAGQDKTKKANQLTESFSEIGCHYVDLQVSDPNVGKEDKVRIWFSVKNALPAIKNVTLSFPQYENTSSGIGFGNTDTNRMSFDCTGTTNLTIKVTAVGVTDPDGMISRLRFYYYNADDPDRKLEYKDTWMSNPYVYFVIPRVGGEYKFGVWVYDNDGGMIDSDGYLASNPAVYFPASCSDSDIPTVTLRVSSQNIQVGDEVTYTVVSKISTNNEDFSTDRTFYYDFTGDGVWDLVTKKDTATYQFLEDYEDGVTPRAAVEYRRKLGKADGATIYVKNGIKPILLYNSIGNTVIFRDLSVGVFQQRNICFETSECEKGNNKFQKVHKVDDLDNLTAGTISDITKNDGFVQNYQEYGIHNVSLYLKSKYGIEAQKDFMVETSNNEANGRIAPGVNMITIPETTFQKIEDPETGKVKDIRAGIFLAKNMNNTLLMYINNENEGTCYIDTDIATDSKGDGITDNDIDLQCNKLLKIKYEPNYENAIGRIYFTVKDESGNETLTFKNFYIGFEGYILDLDEEKTEIYRDIAKLINGIDDISSENTALKNNLNKLRRNLNNTSEVSALVLEINEQIRSGGLKLDSNQKELLESIVARLSNDDTIDTISVGMNDYEKNKRDILALLTTYDGSTIKQEVTGLFDKFEENMPGYTLEEKAEALNGIRDTIIQYYKKNKTEVVNVDDYTIFFCNMFNYFEITEYTDKCGMTVEKEEIQSNYQKSQGSSQSSEKSGGLPLWLTIILVILFGGVLTMIGIIVFFSIKARMNSSSDNDEDEG